MKAVLNGFGTFTIKSWISHPPNTKGVMDYVKITAKAVIFTRSLGDVKEPEGLFGFYLTCELKFEENVMERWFDRTEENRGAITLPESTEIWFA